MKIPSEIKVAGVTYSVVEKDVVIIDGCSEYIGLCCHSESRIEILSSLSQTRKEQVFIHELVHAILNEAGYKEHDEDLVSRFSIIAHQVILDNPLVDSDTIEVESKEGVRLEIRN
ncbi:ImmA/IrrE family metallo-endopeptidase [Listeria booriae]|uniref:ImmA/IrrE family metallo-endopeptidase n=1 Tax=Listeria booriae TaxID=1552123 RepID=UPI0016255D99|nr:ImmA/IrrE family metallo-endopeptidase [Listeria booriae]MBC1272673.1 ImmA/IrrE family metallo-endopeptidase [Listeria booriae]MBC2174750.1 ImmA/IrrE family metallo-endopeptidase [Listeria booriae]